MNDAIKSFDRLSVRTQRLIDCKIFIDEAAAIGNQSTSTPMEDILIGKQPNLAMRVKALRELYAEDTQSTEPAYSAWHDSSTVLLGAAKMIIAADVPGHTKELQNLLEHLPYPQVDIYSPRSRG